MLDPIIDCYEVLTELEENSDELEEKLKKLSTDTGINILRKAGTLVPAYFL